MKRLQVTDALLADIFADDKSVERVSSYLSGVRNGKSVDIRTGLFEDADRISIAKDWLSHLDPQLPDEIMQLELEQMEKIGPLSIQLPYLDRVDTITSYFSKPNSSINGKVLTEAVNRVLQSFPRLHTLTPISLSRASTLMQSSTNSGVPYFKKRKLTRDEDLTLAIHKRWMTSDSMAILGWRGQSSGTQIPKQRVVWMFPQSLNISEAAYFQPIFTLLSNFGQPMGAWISMDEVDTRITRLMDHSRSLGVNSVSTDFSGYDQHLWRGQLQDFAYKIMIALYQQQYRDDISELFIKASNIPLLTPNEIFMGDHGEPSGSNLTNLRDTLINWVVNQYVAIEFGTNLGEFSQFQGDDAVVYHHNQIPTEQLVEAYSSLGLSINLDKQVVGSVVHYLQRLHTRNWKVGGKYVGIYPTMRALNSLMGMERWHNDWNASMASLRALMILENCKHHPQFNQFIDFVMAGDKLALGRNLSGGINSLIGEHNISNAKGIAGFINTFNGPKLDGIRSFEVVKYIMRN